MQGIKEEIRKKVQYLLVGFLYSYFFYLLKKNVDIFLIDQLGRKTFPLLADESSDDKEDQQKQVGFKAPPEEREMESFLNAEEINEFWILGENCAEPFASLSVQERQLLKWRYVDGLRSSQISEKISEHPNTVREHLSKTRDKILRIVVESKMEDVINFLDIKKA